MDHRLLELTDLITSAVAIADRAVVSDIETMAARIGEQSARCYDVRPMLDEREHSPEVVDMVREALGYAVSRRLVEIDHVHQHIMRITQREQREQRGGGGTSRSDSSREPAAGSLPN